jgi:hypothetical protein
MGDVTRLVAFGALIAACGSSPVPAPLTSNATLSAPLTSDPTAVPTSTPPVSVNTLYVVVTGDGQGSITSYPSGIDCPGHLHGVVPEGLHGHAHGARRGGLAFR